MTEAGSMILLEAGCDWANLISLVAAQLGLACIILHRCTVLGLSYRLSISLSADFIGKAAHAPAPRSHACRHLHLKRKTGGATLLVFQYLD
jgi:hypothetical protein